MLETSAEFRWVACGRERFSKGAFTLAEVTLGLGLLAIMALGLLSLFVSSSAASQGGIARVEAINLAAQELDRWKHLPYTEVAGFVTAPLAAYDQQFRGRPYHVELTVRRAAANPSQLEYSLLELDLTVSWEQKDRLDQNGQTNLSSGMARRKESLHAVVAPDANQ